MVRSSENNPPEIEIKEQRHTTPPPVSNRPTSTAPPPPLHHRPPPPLYYQSPTGWIPWLVPVLFTLNMALFYLSMYINNCPAHSKTCIGAQVLHSFAFESLRVNPILGPSTATLIKLGALDAYKVIQQGQKWRILTCMWFHTGLFHVLANMACLLFIGTRLEQDFGFARIGLLYILSGFGGSLLSALFLRATVSIGSSGALFGLLGAMVSELLTNWTMHANKVSASIMLVLLIIKNLLLGIISHVDNWAHIGGFVTGFFLGFILLVRPHFKVITQPIFPAGLYAPPIRLEKYKSYQHILRIFSIIALSVMFTIVFLFVILKVNGNAYCSWCQYLSCVPTAIWSCNPQCNSIQLGSRLNMTCLCNGKSRSYILPEGHHVILVQDLCSKLCI